MDTREFTLKPAHGKERTLTGRQVEIPTGRSAFDLETGKTVAGPATIWQRVKAGGEVDAQPEAAEAIKPKRGRPARKKAAAPPDL